MGKGKTKELKPLTVGKLVRIVPTPHEPGQYCKTQGTKLFLPSGEAIPGVTGIVLRAGIDDVWRAEISMNIDPPDVTCLAEEVSRQQAVGKWHRLWLCVKAIFGPVRHPDASVRLPLIERRGWARVVYWLDIATAAITGPKGGTGPR